MGIRTFLTVVRSRWMLVVAAIVACMLGAVAMTAVTPKSYQASASFYISMSGISSANDAFQATQTAQFRLSSYAKIAASTEVAQDAIDSLGLHLDAQALANSVKVDYAPEAVVFGITVTDSDPNRVVSLVNAMADEFVALVPQLDATAIEGKPAQQVSARIIDLPTRPDAPVSPNPVRNLGLGLVAGVLLGALLALLREKTDKRLRSAERFERVYGSPPLATIDAVISPRGSDIAFGDAPEANAQYRALRTHLLNDLETRARTVYVTSAVTMPTKSTVAVDLAAALASVGDTVVLVPADPASTAMSIIGLTPRSAGLREAGTFKVDEMLTDTSYPGLTIVEGGRDLFDVSAVNRLLTSLMGRYDYIVIEGTPVLPDVDAGLEARQCGGSLLIVQPDTRVDDLKAAVAGLHGAGARLLGIVLVKATQRRSSRRESATAAFGPVGAQWSGRKVFASVIASLREKSPAPSARRTAPAPTEASGPMGSGSKHAASARD